jgi:hypothetical protein
MVLELLASLHERDRNIEGLRHRIDLLLRRLYGPRGGQTAAVLFSFTSTCQRLGVEPWAYLHDVMTRLPAMSAGQLGDLLPDHWQAARQAKAATSPSPATETTHPPAE